MTDTGQPGSPSDEAHHLSPEENLSESSAASDSRLRLARCMADYQDGHLEAFEELYRSLAPKLRGYLNSLTWNANHSEDLLQECFLQVHRSRHTYIRSRPVEPWIFAIARYVFLMDRRARLRRHRLEASTGDNLPEVPIPAEVETLGPRDEVHKALRQLGQDGREALLLHHVWGMSFGEIGRLLGIREGTAKLRAYRSLKTLRQILKE